MEVIRPGDSTQTQDFSGIAGYERLERPLFVAIASTPEDEQDYYYAELYRDGTLRLRANTHVFSEPIDDILLYNPWTHQGSWSRAVVSDPKWLVARARNMLEAAGAPATAFTEQPDTTVKLGTLDPHAGKARASAQRLADQALCALQFSRWSQYDSGKAPQLGMSREHYARALGVLSTRFGDAVLADSAAHTITTHLRAIHTDVHSPGLRHKPHSDGGPREESYLELARQVIRDEHAITPDMRSFGMIVNFLSLYGDTDFWSVVLQQHPKVFHAAVNHLQDMGPEFIQPSSMYVRQAVINPVRLVAEYFPDAYAQITAERPDFVPTPGDPPALTVERL